MVHIHMISHENCKEEVFVHMKNCKTFRIKIELDGTVSASAPKQMRLKSIKALLDQKAMWIFQQLVQIRTQLKQSGLPELDRQRGGIIFCNGQSLEFVVQQDLNMNKPWARISNKRLLISARCLDKELLTKVLNQWYKERAKGVFRERVAHFAPLVGVVPGSILVKDQKTRWGSCSSKKNINFNWRLLLAPQWVLDYVVVHELCHLVHLNHSKLFWQVVADVMPNYVEARNWLKEKGATLATWPRWTE